MSRYACHGQEVLKRDDKLVGFNAGYNFCSEHEWRYKGRELMRTKRSMSKNKKHPFNGEIVENPEAINLIEFSDGRVWLTNDERKYSSLMSKTEEERYGILNAYINNDDRKRYEEFASKVGENVDTPEVIALWSTTISGGGNFDLISTNEQSTELIKTLYDEMKKGNVAISTDYSFMFEDRGLSFVLLDQLTPEDFKNKQLVDHHNEIASQFQREYKDYLQTEGLHGESCIIEGCKYPAEFWNLQIDDVKTNIKGERVPSFYLEIVDTSKGRKNLDALTMHRLCHLTGDEIKALVPVVKSQEYTEYARNHNKEDVETYLLEELALHRERKNIETSRYLADKEAFARIATEQRKGVVEKSSLSLRDKIRNWLHPNRQKDPKTPEI